MTILVTGAAGFIASHIADALIKEGAKVVIVDNLSTGKEENINPKALFYKADITSKEDLDRIFKETKPSIISHHAAQMDVRLSVKDPVYDAEQNIIGSINLFEHAREYGVKKITFASTGGAIYGEQEYFPADEKHNTNPISPYGIAKLAIEKYLYYYYKEYNTQYTALRYSNVYGPRQNHLGEAGVVAIFINKLLNEEAPSIFGDGTQTRDYIYIEDVVQYNISAIKNNKLGAFNVGTAKETSVNTLFDIIRKKSNTNIKAKYSKAKIGEQKRSSISPLKASEYFSYTPTTDLTSGIYKTIKYFKTKVL